jgi:hypothetical protein
VSACAVPTDVTVAVNPALVALAGTFTAAGTATATLLLDRFTLRPPLGAAEVRVTMQESVPDPVMDPALQETAFNAATGELVAPIPPVPLRAITTLLSDEDLLVMVS